MHMCVCLMQMAAPGPAGTAAVSVIRTCPSVTPVGRDAGAARTAPPAGCRRTGPSGPAFWPSRGSSCCSSSSACWWPTSIGGTGWVRALCATLWIAWGAKNDKCDRREQLYLHNTDVRKTESVSEQQTQHNCVYPTDAGFEKGSGKGNQAYGSFQIRQEVGQFPSEFMKDSAPWRWFCSRLNVFKWSCSHCSVMNRTFSSV